MIQLDHNEKLWIKLCKGHYREKYPYKGKWVQTLKSPFIEIYGWNPDEDNNYQDYLRCIFTKLLEIWLKVQDDRSGHNHQLMELFSAAFYKSIVNSDKLPIERTIAKLCGLIQCNIVIEKNGEKRYEL